MIDRSRFDPLLGRLVTDVPTTVNGGGTVNNITQSTVSTVGAGTGTSLPATGNNGDIFYDTDDGVLYIWANGMWNAISGGGTTDPGADIFGLLLTRNLQ